jgi:hypothetical protein
MHPLSGIQAKMVRSRQHYDALNGEINAFLGRNPVEIIADLDAQKRSHTLRAKTTENVPLSIRVLIGETLTQLRSALDHLAWQLALLTIPQPPSTTEFPIFPDSASYTRDRERKIGALPDTAKAIIDTLQPHTSANPMEHPLWVLHRLANDDKHRLLHIVFGAPRGIDIATRGRDMSFDIRMGPFNDQTDIGSIHFLNPAETDMDVDAGCFIDLAFSNDTVAKGQFVREEIRILYETVDKVVKRFSSFFP